MARLRAVRLHPDDAPRLHGDHEQPTVREPAQPTREVVELDLDDPLAIVADAGDGVLVEVGEPQPIVVPARPFAEVDAADEDGGPGHAGEPTARARAPKAPRGDA